MLQSDLPFTQDGWIVAITDNIVPRPTAEAWREIIESNSYLSDDQRRLSIEASNWISAPAANQPGFHIAGDLRVVAIQGGWWYRGVTAVRPHAAGALVTHVVVNVAPGWTRWLAHLLHVRPYRQAVSRS